MDESYSLLTEALRQSPLDLGVDFLIIGTRSSKTSGTKNFLNSELWAYSLSLDHDGAIVVGAPQHKSPRYLQLYEGIPEE
jgi:hypothetical protein